MVYDYEEIDYEDLPSQRFSMVPGEQYDVVMYIDYLEE